MHILSGTIGPGVTCLDPEGEDRGSPPPPHPPKNRKNIGFLSNTGMDPLKFSKLPSQHLMLGHHQYTSEWRFAGRISATNVAKFCVQFADKCSEIYITKSTAWSVTL